MHPVRKVEVKPLTQDEAQKQVSEAEKEVGRATAFFEARQGECEIDKKQAFRTTVLAATPPKFYACPPGKQCTFDVTMDGTHSSKGSKGASSQQQTNDIDTSLVVKITYEGGNDKAAVMRLEVEAMCSASSQEHTEDNHITKVYGRKYTDDLQNGLKAHPVFFTQHSSGICNTFCFSPKDSDKYVVEFKERLIKTFCSQIASANTIAETEEIQRLYTAEAKKSTPGGRSYSVLMKSGVEHPFIRKFHLTQSQPSDKHHTVYFEDDFQDESLASVETPLRSTMIQESIDM
jgi:hypothetical protein